MTRTCDDDPEPEIDPPSAGSAPEEWRAAQGALAVDLAELAFRFGALDARLASAGEGARLRLALSQAERISWWAGDRVGAPRLALWLALRLGSEGEAAALGRAGWAVRRLTGGPGPEEAAARPAADGTPRARQVLAAFLDRPDEAAIARLAEDLAATRALHPVVRGARAFELWQALRPRGPATRVEAAVLAARLAAPHGGGALFLPLALGGAAGSGTRPARLAGWIDGARRGVMAARRELDAIALWEERARDRLADRSGRTPPALCATLAAWPLVSVPMAARLTGASRAAVQRNFDLFAARGLVREATGQGRYRMWRAAL